MSAPVALVLVSHSTYLARGVAELAAQMAPDVVIRTAAGGPDGGLGTSFDTVQAAITAALGTVGATVPDDGARGGVVVLADLGSSVLTVETVLELDESLAGSVVLARGPFVEGAVAAAVTAHGGATLDEVVASALAAAHSFTPAGTPGGTGGTGWASGARGEADAGGERPASDTVTGQVTVRNPLGLHARPAALVSRKVAELGAKVRVDGVDASSVLQLMALGATEGRELTVEAEGPGAAEAVRVVVGMIEGGFGEI